MSMSEILLFVGVSLYDPYSTSEGTGFPSPLSYISRLERIPNEGMPHYSSWRLLLQVYLPEDGPQREIVGRFERSRQDERQPEHEQGTLKQQTGEDRAGGRTQTARERSDAGRRSAFFRVHQRHRVGLASRDVHLRKRLAEEQQCGRDGKGGRKGHQGQQDVGWQVREDHCIE